MVRRGDFTEEGFRHLRNDRSKKEGTSIIERLGILSISICLYNDSKRLSCPEILRSTSLQKTNFQISR